jgi:ATP-dependent Clp protease adaptor protein ClpS
VATDIEFDIENDLELTHGKRYKVYILNDDYTSMNFVVNILIEIFHKDYKEAEKLMLEVHEKGQGLCGIYTYEVAETKIAQVHNSARKSGYPLKAYMEEE